MKKLFLLILALSVCGAAMAQEQEPKKKGGLWNAIKKGVESTTGLNVSKETLFVYPEIAVWKMSLVSCTGNPSTGEVEAVISVQRIDGQQTVGTAVIVDEARVTGGREALKLEQRYVDPLHDFTPGVAVEVKLNNIYGVPADAKSLDIKFHFRQKDGAFEARDMPVTWRAAE